MRIVLTGPNGQIGWELRRALASVGEVLCAGRSIIDLTDEQSIRSGLRDANPDLIINAGAYTGVDRAEQDAEAAEAVNVDAPAIIAETACALGAAMIHYSTDYVFDGRSSQPYSPGDEAHPISVYGRTKLAGEHAIANEGARALIIRTSWVYSWRGNNFLRSILAKATESSSVSVVNDQFGSPTWSRVVADQTAHMIETSLKRDEDGSWGFGGLEGTYHMCCSGQVSWFEFAQAILDETGLSKTRELHAIGSAEYPRAADRPRYSVLDCSKTEQTFGITMPSWRTTLVDAFRESDVAGTISSNAMRKGA